MIKNAESRLPLGGGKWGRTVKKGLSALSGRPFGGLQRRYAFFSFFSINYSFIEAGSMVTVMQFFFPRMTSLANFWISAEVRVL